MYQGALTQNYEYDEDDEGSSNLSREMMIELIHMGFDHNPRYPMTIYHTPRYQTYPIPFEEVEISSIADLNLQTLGRNEYDWTYEQPPPRISAFARFEFISSESSRGGTNHRRITSPNSFGIYERPPPLIQRLQNVRTDKLYVHHDLLSGMMFFSRSPTV